MAFDVSDNHLSYLTVERVLGARPEIIGQIVIKEVHHEAQTSNNARTITLFTSHLEGRFDVKIEGHEHVVHSRFWSGERPLTPQAILDASDCSHATAPVWSGGELTDSLH
jgi:hypothetical protein